MPVSIKEVAARAGVSFGTVSKVLNESRNAQIALPTRERVRCAARELGYHPSAVARALVRKQMDTIGIVLTRKQTSPLGSPFFSVLFDAVLAAAALRYQNTTIFTGHQWQNTQTSLPIYRDGRCDGLLLFYQLPDSDIVSSLLDANMPVAMICDRREDPRLSWVDVENEESAYKITSYLLSLGHRRIALVYASDDLDFVPPRRDGYLRAHREAEVVVDPTLLFACGFNFESTNNAMSRILSLPANRRPTAFCCLSDGEAGMVMTALQQRGYLVPQDFSVTGFNGDQASERSVPCLTTMKFPFQEIADSAIALLLEQTIDINNRGRIIVYPTELTVRESTAPPST